MATWNSPDQSVGGGGRECWESRGREEGREEKEGKESLSKIQKYEWKTNKQTNAEKMI